MKNKKIYSLILISIFLLGTFGLLKSQTKSFSITHSLSQNIDTETSVACNTNLYSYENSYYRVFDLYNFFNVNADWVVQSIELGIASAVAGNGNTQNITANFYTMSAYDNSISLEDLTLIGSQILSIDNSFSGQVKNFTLSLPVTVPKEQILVVEIFVPDYSETQNIFFIGSNKEGQTDFSYIRAPQCGVDLPLTTDENLFPDMMIVMNLRGDYASPNPEILAFNIENQVVETELLNSPEYTIKVVMPADADLSALTPQIIIPAGYIITPQSGQTVDFSAGPVEYTVTNEFRKVSQTWQATVKNATPDIISFSLPEQIADASINGNPLYTVDVIVAEGTNLSELKPLIGVYPGFTVSPASGELVDFSSGSAVYTVSHESLPISQQWTVNVSEAVSVKNVSDGNFRIFPVPASDFVNVEGENIQKICVTDLSGKVITSVDINSDKTEINTSKLNSGIYFLKIYSEQNIYIEKIVISE